MLTRVRKLVALTTSATLLLSACLRMPPTETPIPTIASTADHAAGKTLIVMLPGMGDRAQTFVTRDFIDIAGQQGFASVAVDAHLGYYRERSLLTRIREDVILPARKQGYDSTWLLGISMGGFGALLYTQAHPDDIDGLILLAPWLGGDSIVSDVRSAASLTAWNPDGKTFPAHEVDVWRWLQEQVAVSGAKPIMLGYGNSDRLADAYGPLADVVPVANTYTRDGGHKWTTWRPLWSQIASEFSRTNR